MTVDLRRDHLVSLNEWDAMPEDMCRRLELVNGVLELIASPVPLHQWAARHLANWLDEQLPDVLIAECDVDVVLQSGARATVCRPDVVVTSAEAYGDGRHRLDAADVLLAAEVVSPGSKRADRVTKPMRYAKAGITRYWVIDLDEPTSLAAFELVDDVYEPVEEGVGTFELTWPVRWSVDLKRLTRRR